MNGLNVNDHFWEGGDIEYAAVLEEEYEALREKLRAQLQSSDDFIKAELQAKLEQAKVDYERKLNELDQSMF